jgi:hypothetical protein
MHLRRRRLAIAAIVLAAAGAAWLLDPGRASAPAVVRADAHGATPVAAVRASSAAAPAIPAVPVAAGPGQVDDAACVAPPWPAAHLASDAAGDLVIVTDAPRLSAGIAAARARIEARLRASADPYANAVAVWLDRSRDDDPDGAANAERRRRLAALAAGTHDPRLYALALGACWRRDAPSSCPSLSARRWAELDPGNAMPWLLLADEAAAQGDLSGLQEALFHIGQSARVEEHGDAPLQPVVDAVVDDADLAGAQSLAIDAIGIAAADPWPSVPAMCRHATPADANAWQQCRAVIELLENRADSLMLRAAGASLDRRLTGATAPAARVSALVRRWTLAFPVRPSGCAEMRRGLALLRDAAVRGQAAAAGGDAP